MSTQQQFAFCVLFILILVGSVHADNSISPIGALQPSGSDAQAQSFNTFTPTVNSYITNNTITTPMGQNFFIASDVAGVASVVTDPANLQLQTASDVRAYFLSAPAPTAWDSMGFNINHNYMLTPGQAALIFNVNAPGGSPNVPATSGEFVNLGTLKASTFLDFFLMATTGGTTTTWWNNQTQNPDGFPHLSMVQFLNTPYYLLAWEDANLADQTDINSLYRSLFAVISVVPTPEPSTYLVLASFLTTCFVMGYRKKNRQASFKSSKNR